MKTEAHTVELCPATPVSAKKEGIIDDLGSSSPLSDDNALTPPLMRPRKRIVHTPSDDEEDHDGKLTCNEANC